MSTKEIAIAAYKERDKALVWEHEENKERERKAADSLFHDWFGKDAIIESIALDNRDCPVLYTEPTMPPLLYHTQHGQGLFRVLGTCPECGNAAWSYPCWNIADIGKQLSPETFVTDYSYRHTCPTPPQKPTTDYLALAKEHFKEAEINGYRHDIQLAHVAILIHNAVTVE